jgi:hypothetical protein
LESYAWCDEASGSAVYGVGLRRSIAGIAVSNPAGGMDVCRFRFVGGDLCDGSITSPGVTTGCLWSNAKITPYVYSGILRGSTKIMSIVTSPVSYCHVKPSTSVLCFQMSGGHTANYGVVCVSVWGYAFLVQFCKHLYKQQGRVS